MQIDCGPSIHSSKSYSFARPFLTINPLSSVRVDASGLFLSHEEKAVAVQWLAHTTHTLRHAHAHVRVRYARARTHTHTHTAGCPGAGSVCRLARPSHSLALTLSPSSFLSLLRASRSFGALLYLLRRLSVCPVNDAETKQSFFSMLDTWLFSVLPLFSGIHSCHCTGVYHGEERLLGRPPPALHCARYLARIVQCSGLDCSVAFCSGNVRSWTRRVLEQLLLVWH